MRAVAARRQSETVLWAFWAADFYPRPGKAWRFLEWQSRWRYLPSWLTFLEMMRSAWRQTRKRQLIYRYFCLVRKLGWEDKGHRQMAPCLLKEEQRKNGDKRWSHKESCFPFRKLGPFMPARLCGSTAETLLGERTWTKRHSGGWTKLHTTSTKPPRTQFHKVIPE